MNREIKFRAWSNKWDKMVYPNDERLTIQISNGGGPHSIWDDLRDEEGVPIMQYTGVKDKNAREIYEGDILLKAGDPRYVREKYLNQKYTVEWDTSYCTFRCTPHVKMADNYIWWPRVSECEVIGNIYENPELLK